jgi:hypothetical protein
MLFVILLASLISAHNLHLLVLLDLPDEYNLQQDQFIDKYFAGKMRRL